MKDLPKTWVSSNNQLTILDQKIQKILSCQGEQIVLAGHDMVTDAGSATMCIRNFKAPWLQTKNKKIKDLPKTWVSRKNRLKISDEKKNLSS